MVCAAAQEAGEPAGQAVAAAVGQMVVAAVIVGAGLMAVDVVGRPWAAVATAGAGLVQMVAPEVGQAEPAVGAPVVRASSLTEKAMPGLSDAKKLRRTASALHSDALLPVSAVRLSAFGVLPPLFRVRWLPPHP